ncbi:MAG: hypothetical protein CMM09_01220 [Rhodospirillaceae bacterium]|nr:hypothetical protein [Rhodospirillaceae bacterium]
MTTADREVPSRESLAQAALWYMWTKLNIDKSLIANLNSIKREFALIAAGAVAVSLGGGTYFTLLEEAKKARTCVSSCLALLSK